MNTDVVIRSALLWSTIMQALGLASFFGSLVPLFLNRKKLSTYLLVFGAVLWFLGYLINSLAVTHPATIVNLAGSLGIITKILGKIPGMLFGIFVLLSLDAIMMWAAVKALVAKKSWLAAVVLIAGTFCILVVMFILQEFKVIPSHLFN